MHFKLFCKMKVTSFCMIYVIEYIYNGNVCGVEWKYQLTPEDKRNIIPNYKIIIIDLKKEIKGKNSIGIHKHFTKIKEEYEGLQIVSYVL